MTNLRDILEAHVADGTVPGAARGDDVAPVGTLAACSSSTR
jgi:hypothetical protein